MMQMEDDEIEAEAADEQEDSSGPRKVIKIFVVTQNFGKRCTVKTTDSNTVV